MKFFDTQIIEDLKKGGYIKKFANVFSFDLAAKGLAYLFLPIFLRLMTKEEFGLYTYLIFIFTNVSFILKFGMDTAQSKLYYDYEGNERGKMIFTINSALFIVFFIAIISIVAFNLDLKLLKFAIKDYVISSNYRIPIILYVGLLIVTMMLNTYYVAANKVITFQRFNLLKAIAVNLIAIVVLFFLKNDKILDRLLVESILGILLFVPLILKYLGNFYYKFDYKILKRSLYIGLPMLGSVLINIIYSFSDKYLLQKSASLTTLAVYNLAIFLVMPVSLIYGSFHMIWFPKFFSERNLRLNYHKTIKVYKYFILFYVVLFVFFWIAIYLCIQWGVFQKSYKEILWILPVLYFYKVVEGLSGLFTNFIILKESTVFTLVVTIVFSIVAFVLFQHFIPIYGIYGASFILLLLEILRTIVLIIFTKKAVKNFIITERV